VDGSLPTVRDDELPTPASFPSRNQFLGMLGVADAKAPALLRVLLARMRPDAPLAELVVVFEQLGRFIVAGPAIATAGPSAHARLELLVLALERVPEARDRMAGALSALLRDVTAVRLLAVVGLPNDRGLWAETTDRLAERFLPAPPNPRDLAAMVGAIVRTHDDYQWLGPSDDALLDRLAHVLDGSWAPLAAASADAVALLGTRIAALGVGENLRNWSDTDAIRTSAFFQLGRAALPEVPALLTACHAELARIRDALEEHGVSVDVVYSLDAIERGLLRIARLVPVAAGAAPAQTVRELLIVLGRGLVGERSFHHLVRDNLRLMARKVIERAGRTGEHYVTSSRREYWKMLTSAAGGGVVTAGTATGKFLVKWAHFPLFGDGVMSSLLYAGSFLIIQFLGFTLATKQPSMTAAALAVTIRDRAGPDRLTELVALIARISRSQFAAAIGNVATVIVVMLGFDWLWQYTTGAPFLDAHTAVGVIRSFHPWHSGTVPFAIFTGVLLWMSSIVAGWFENWIVYRRIPEGIEHHALGKRFGRPRMARLARSIERQAAGVGGSISLGVFLGMTKPVATFLGLPLDVRHVTLSSGSLALAVSSVGVDTVGWNAIVWAWIGIAIIGLCNFGVSFSLALLVALRARDVGGGEQRTLPRAVLGRFIRRPLEFFWPPRDRPTPSTKPPPAH